MIVVTVAARPPPAAAAAARLLRAVGVAPLPPGNAAPLSGCLKCTVVVMMVVMMVVVMVMPIPILWLKSPS